MQNSGFFCIRAPPLGLSRVLVGWGVVFSEYLFCWKLDPLPSNSSRSEQLCGQWCWPFLASACVRSMFTFTSESVMAFQLPQPHYISSTSRSHAVQFAPSFTVVLAYSEESCNLTNNGYALLSLTPAAPRRHHQPTRALKALQYVLKCRIATH